MDNYFDLCWGKLASVFMVEGSLRFLCAYYVFIIHTKEEEKERETGTWYTAVKEGLLLS